MNEMRSYQAFRKDRRIAARCGTNDLGFFKNFGFLVTPSPNPWTECVAFHKDRMPSLDSAADTLFFHAHHDHSTITLVAAGVCLFWYSLVCSVCILGCVQIWRYYSHPPDCRSSADLEAAPHVTIIRPIKGLEPYLYDCLASTFLQHYPKQKLQVRFCVSSRDDPALPVLDRLLRDFPDFDAKILVEDEDVLLQDGTLDLGPNPKIRNMSRAYREAPRGKDDLIWIADCNIWIGKHTCGRMVARTCRYKFVHQLPIVVDTLGTTLYDETQNSLHSDVRIRTTSETSARTTLPQRERSLWNIGGGRLEELFMSSMHPKFYAAINTVLVAPATVGKSTMFHRVHLDSLTNGQGLDSFSFNICEDQLMGDLFWKKKLPEELQGEKWGKHDLCFGDLAIQPMSNMSIGEYWNRRIRWLRVRKYTVTLATLVEPGTEPFTCSLYGAYAVTTVPFFNPLVGIPQTWTAFTCFWLLSVSIWCFMDWKLYQKLHSSDSVYVDENTPDFARPPNSGRRRPVHQWLLAWLSRETLALPIWLWAFYGGATVEWRGKKLWVGMDMKVHEIPDVSDAGHSNGHLNGKARQD